MVVLLNIVLLSVTRHKAIHGRAESFCFSPVRNRSKYKCCTEVPPVGPVESPLEEEVYIYIYGER